MSSETSNVSATKVEAPNYRAIADQLVSLMVAGREQAMDQMVIRAAIETFGQVASQRPSYNEAAGGCIKGY